MVKGDEEMSFVDIAGNPRVKKILAKALERKRVPNSMLFTGPEGVGKKATALVLAKALNCLRKEEDSCDSCPSCVAIEQGNFPDVMLVEAPASVIKIDQIRMVKQMAHMKPMVGKRRVFIIVDAHKMNEEAQNSLLKILEEPPPFTHIILITSNPYLILPTVKSRCQILAFSRISKEEIEKILNDRGYEKEQAQLISLIVRGNLEKALSLEWEDVQRRRKEAWTHFLSLLHREDISSLVENYTSGRKRIQRDELEELFDFFSSFCRDFILVKEGGERSHLLNPDLETEIGREERDFSLEQMTEALKQIDFAIHALNRNVNVNLLVSYFYSNFLEGENV